MSVDFTIFIPRDPTLVPNAAAQQLAAELAANVFPDAGEIVLEESERVEFVFAAENSEAPSCPHCGADLDNWF